NRSHASWKSSSFPWRKLLICALRLSVLYDGKNSSRKALAKASHVVNLF
ncbi:hypothetical protein LINGRAHAP2_LOCUS1734, partial [Linum grandiflorum]